jgi:hypothetical protein
VADRPRKLVVQLTATGLPPTSVTVDCKPDELRKIAFPAPPAAPGSNPAETAFAIEGPLQVRVTEAETGTLVGRRQVQLGVAAPAEYLQVTNIQFTPQGPTPAQTNRLAVKLKSTGPLGATPCIVELVLPARRVPGLLGLKDGVLKGEIPPEGGALELWAEDLRFLPGVEENGFVSLTIDGRERAMVFQTTFARSGDPITPRPDFATDLRFRAARYAPATATLTVDVETDNAPAGASLEVALGDGRDDGFRPALEQRIPEAQRRRFLLNPAGPGGALLLQGSVQQDWAVALAAARLLGRHTLRMRLLDRDGSPIKTLYENTVLDDSPPERVQFVELAPKVPRDVPFILRASGADAASGISEVSFYLGKPVDGKLPPNLTPIAAQPVDQSRTLWSARIPLTPEQKGPLDLTAVFTNGVGLTSAVTKQIEIVETDPAKFAPGSVDGKLMEGSRPQQKLKVILVDAKGAVREVTSKDDGSFLFEGVAPGPYRLAAAKTVPAKVAAKDIIVQPGKRTSVTLELFLR